MLQVNIYEAKTKLSRLIEKAEAGEEVIIARSGKPVVRLVPVHKPSGNRKPGGWEGRLWMAEDFDDDSALSDLFREGEPFPPEE